MRILLLALLLAACSKEAPAPTAEKRLYAGAGRDRLCMAGARAGFITYGEGNANCAVRGRLDHSGEAPMIVPDGDEDCHIAVREQGRSLVLGRVEAACAFYCGPGASFADKSFTESASASPAVDFAGDPLC